MKTRTKLIVGASGVVLITLLLTEGVIIPKQLQPDALPLRFVRYNDPELMMATFEMKNESDSPVVVWENAILISRGGEEEFQQSFTLERTDIPENETRRLTVPAARSNAWRVAFNVARFGTRQKKRFEAGKEVNGTIVYSDLVSHKSANY